MMNDRRGADAHLREDLPGGHTAVHDPGAVGFPVWLLYLFEELFEGCAREIGRERIS